MIRFTTILQIILFGTLLFIRYQTSSVIFKDGQDVTIQGMVLDSKTSFSEKTTFSIKGYSISCYRCSVIPKTGETARVEGKITLVNSRYDISAYNITISDNVTPVGKVLHTASTLRNNLSNATLKKIVQPHAGLLLGLTLGEKGYIGRDFYNILVQTGTIHVAVVSGYNVGVLIGFLFPYVILLKKNLARFFVILVSLIIFVVLVGFSPPVLRASSFFIVVFWGKLFGRQINGLRLAILCAFVMLFINPNYITDPSFTMSFGAFLGIMLLEKPLSQYVKFTFYGLEESLSTTLAAQIMVFPLVSYYFGNVSLISIFTNFLCLWVVPYATISGIAFLFLVKIPIISNIVAFGVYALLNYFVVTTTLLSYFKLGFVQYRFSLGVLAVYYAMLLLILYLNSKRRNKLDRVV
ncbi:ComEC/Rec2 family competence protein [Candidatus Parcubacteria bacterium]|nr:ComEC/Rec2 family competence protein [Patescibacteria group bacterium]MBU4380989.1 ComEC/Rec2 family competence protein [Patescibacteria group bacterium]MCG2689301.1 ComEC/Rec2 family competence protein [Candidatus Parcubacteria bacterium]